MFVTVLLIPAIRVKYVQPLGLSLQNSLKKDGNKCWLLISSMYKHTELVMTVSASNYLFSITKHYPVWITRQCGGKKIVKSKSFCSVEMKTGFLPQEIEDYICKSCLRFLLLDKVYDF